MQNKRFKTTKLNVNGNVLDKIANSNVMTEKEKIQFMSFVGYMTDGEQKELTQVI